MIKLIFRLLAALFLLSTPIVARAQQPPQTRNAALRLLAGRSANCKIRQATTPPGITLEIGFRWRLRRWNDSLSPILDNNLFAIEIMQRATLLLECDWGVEYDQGPRASIAYVPRARVLARLNTLYGMRADAEGDTQKAVGTWLAGIRFSQSTLPIVAACFLPWSRRETLISNFHALSTRSGAWDQLPISVRASASRSSLWSNNFQRQDSIGAKR